ncbi:hypothetical protein KC19_8G189000 [Ceratodon purpureus]|uniref:Uncharacterized protein n=1 Tax=Ceratodon purpureus TaxID=3225 RepID=A0A8T0H512_CERPU|nr:hypothetical protein KC19_8G189000 [Ceratodon purpureus]
MSKRGSSLVPIVDALPEEAPPPPPPRDPKVPLTFDEMWFNADDEIQDEEVRNHAKELKAHIMVKATEVRRYLEDGLMVAVILQALQHMIVDRPLDPFRYLAHFIKGEGPNIADEIERAKRLAAAKQAARDKAKRDGDEADRLAREAAEAAAKALRDREAAKLAAAARKAAEDAKIAGMLRLQQSAAKAAAVAADAIEIPIPKAEKRKKAPSLKQLPNKPSWQK